MAAIFPRWSNKLTLIVALGLPVALMGAVGAVTYWFSPWYTDVGYQPNQPVPFSHALHAGGLGLDCRYCHNTVEHAAKAAVPPTATCMNCHTQVRKDSPRLEPLRQSWESGRPIPWIRVHQLPDYAYFDHSAHLAAGVGCASCHGRVDHMDVVRMDQPLSMRWCLDCHRDPQPHLRPTSEITNMAYDPEAAGYDPASDADRTRTPNPPEHCSGCHR